MPDPDSTDAADPGQRVILLVDDSAEDRRRIRRLLSQDVQAKYFIHEADKVSEALKSFREKRPHAVLLDHHLPDGNGIELLEALQDETDADGCTAFVMLTATAGPEIAVEAMRRGAHDYLNKGTLQPSELKKALANALEKARLARELEKQRLELVDKNDELESQLAERRKAERALHESEALSQSIFDASGDCIEILDLDGRLKQINRPGLRLLEIEDAAQVQGKEWQARWSESVREMAAAALDRAKAGEDGRLQGLRPTQRGAIKWWDVMISPIRNADGQVGSLVAISRDITEAKLHETALAEAKAVAEAANRAKDDFLAALSHELRTPLNPVLLIASERETDPELPSDVAEDFASIRKNVELESRLIDDLLDLTRIERGKLRLDIQRVNLHTLLRSSLELLNTDIASKGLRVEVENSFTDLLLDADPVRMQQVFWNVVKNAVRFTPSEGKITISLNAGAEGWVQVIVRDNGAGIEQSELKTIFASFNQGRSGHRFGGLGLGLAITRGLLELHGGSITAASEGLGKGATFTLEIPLAAGTEMTRAASSKSGPAAPGKGLRILLVEDHEPTSVTLHRLLVRRNYDVITAASLKEGLIKAEASTFDIVLSDVGLPDGTGYDVLRRLRIIQPWCKGIALSGYGMDADVNNSLTAGFDVHLTKPIAMQALMAAIEKVALTIVR